MKKETKEIRGIIHNKLVNIRSKLSAGDPSAIKLALTELHSIKRLLTEYPELKSEFSAEIKNIEEALKKLIMQEEKAKSTPDRNLQKIEDLIDKDPLKASELYYNLVRRTAEVLDKTLLGQPVSDEDRAELIAELTSARHQEIKRRLIDKLPEEIEKLEREGKTEEATRHKTYLSSYIKKKIYKYCIDKHIDEREQQQGSRVKVEDLQKEDWHLIDNKFSRTISEFKEHLGDNLHKLASVFKRRPNALNELDTASLSEVAKIAHQAMQEKIAREQAERARKEAEVNAKRSDQVQKQTTKVNDFAARKAARQVRQTR